MEKLQYSDGNSCSKVKNQQTQPKYGFEASALTLPSFKLKNGLVSLKLLSIHKALNSIH